MNEQLIGDLFAEATRRMTGSSSREFSQKFAELIVRECCLVIRNDGSAFNNMRYTRSEIAKMIEDHFGVEE